MAHASCFANFSVLVQVNEHMMDMFCNWWFHYQLLKIHNPVYVVAHGADVVATLVNDYRLAPERILSPPRMAAAGAGALAGSVRNFGSASFYALNTAKIRAAGDLMARTGRSVVFSDLDTVWLRSPLEQLERLPPEKAFAIGPEGSPLDFNHAASTTLAPRAPSPPPPAQARKYYVCACFFAACPSGAARAIFDTWWTASGRETGRGNEQEGFEWLLNLWPELVSGTASASRGAARTALLKSKRIPRGIAELLAAGDGWLEDLLRNSSDGLHLDGGARESDARRMPNKSGQCARDPQCLQRAEELILSGDLFSSFSMLRAVQQQPFAVATHLPAQRNLYWASHLMRDSTETNEQIEAAGRELLETFAQTREYIEAAPPETEWDTDAISIHDLPVQRAVCLHPMYDRHRRPDMWMGMDAATRWRRRYLDLLKRSLTRYLARDLTEDVRLYKGGDAAAVQEACEADEDAGDGSACEAAWHIGQGANQVDGPYSQKWLSGLVHLEVLLEDVLARKVAGDWIEAGCYTGGTSVLMRALLQMEDDDELDARGQKHPRSASEPRRLLLADSFEGIPMPRSSRGKSIDTSAEWPVRYAAGQAQTRSTLRRYGLLDERVVFVPGYFNESLPSAPATAFSFIHIDADAYDSVLDALNGLYSKLTVGGHVVIDDFHLPGVRAAVRDFRQAQNITDPILPVPSDHVTACATDWGSSGTLTIHPLTVAYWTRS